MHKFLLLLTTVSVIAFIGSAQAADESDKFSSDNNGSYDRGDQARDQTNIEFGRSGDVSGGVYGATDYSQPGKGADGPQQGTQRGSTSESSGGVYIRKDFP